MTDNRFIKVRFTENKPGKNAYIWDVIADLGYVSPADAMKIATEVADTKTLKPLCTGPVGVQLTYNTTTPYMRPMQFGTLDIQSLFNMPKAYANEDAHPMPCVMTNCSKLSKKKRAKICAAKLAAGRCMDEYMRRTVGAILYPQHYATQKVK